MSSQLGVRFCFPPISRRILTFPLWMRLNKVQLRWRRLMKFPCACLQGMAFTLEERLQLGTHGLLPPCFISQDVQLMRVLKNYDMRKDDLDRWGWHSHADGNFLISHRLQLSWGEFPKAPQRIFLPLCTRRGLTSGSLQNTRGRLVIIPLRATSISEHGVFHWTSLPLSVLPLIYPSHRCSPSWLFLQRPQRPNENSGFVCFIRLWGLIVFAWRNESSSC